MTHSIPEPAVLVALTGEQTLIPFTSLGFLRARPIYCLQLARWNPTHYTCGP